MAGDSVVSLLYVKEIKADAWLVISSVERDHNHGLLVTVSGSDVVGEEKLRMANTELKNLFDIVVHERRGK